MRDRPGGGLVRGLGERGWKGDELAGGASGRAADRRGADAGEAARERGDEETELDAVGVQRRRDEGGGGRDEHPEGGREDEVGEVGEEMPKEGEEPREPTEDAVAEGARGNPTLVEEEGHPREVQHQGGERGVVVEESTESAQEGGHLTEGAATTGRLAVQVARVALRRATKHARDATVVKSPRREVATVRDDATHRRGRHRDARVGRNHARACGDADNTGLNPAVKVPHTELVSGLSIIYSQRRNQTVTCGSSFYRAPPRKCGGWIAVSRRSESRVSDT